MNINISGVNNNTSLENSVPQGKNNVGQGSIDISTASSSKDGAGLALLQNMRRGDVFTGKILDITQDQVTLLIKGEAQVTATLSDAFSYNIGDYASFSVKDNSSGTIILKSVNSENLKNLMNDRTISRAIVSAGLSVNDTTVSLVNNLMKQGLPIDGSTLNHYAKILESVPNGTPEDVIFLTKMGVPVTQENITALHDFYDFNEGITSKSSEMATEFTEALSYSVAEENGMEAEFKDTGIWPEGENKAVAELIRNLTESFTPTGKKSDSMWESMDKQTIVELSEDIKQLVPWKEETPDIKDMPESAIKRQITEKDIEVLSGKILDGKFTSKEFLNELSRLVENDSVDKKALSKLFKSREFKDTVENMLRQEMSIKPQDFSADNLKRIYAKIINDSARISQKFGSNPSMSGFVDIAGNAAADVNFLNDAGKFMSFVQIPLKMSGKNAKGDLYVYTDKRTKKDANGELKAFLHLDMDNLGPLDVLVNLNGKRVTTNFKVATDSILDYIESHIDELNMALDRLGYNASTQVQISEKNYSFKETVLENEMPPAKIRRYSFDVRA